VQEQEPRSDRPRKIFLKQCKLQEIGLSLEFCEAVIEEKEINPAIKSAVLDYYTEVFVDSEPFRSIVQHPLNCIDFNKIDHMTLNSQIYSMINCHDSEEADQTDETLTRIEGFHHLTLLAIRQAFSLFPRRYAEHKTDGRQAGVGKEMELNENSMTSNLDLASNVLSFLLEYQSSVLTLLNMQLMLGLADSSLIKMAIECAGLVLKVDHEKIQNIDKSSILFFFKYCRRKPGLKQAFQKLVTKSLDLLQTLLSVRRHYQIIALLKLWSISEKSSFLNQNTWKEVLSDVFNIFSLSVEPKKDEKPLSLSLMNKSFSTLVQDIFPEENMTRKASMGSDDLSFEIDPIDEVKRFRKEIKPILFQRMPLDLILVENLFKSQFSSETQNYQVSYNARQDSNYIQERAFQEEFAKRVCNIIISNLDQAQYIFQILNSLVVFQGSIQRKIYRTLAVEERLKPNPSNEKLNESVPISEKEGGPFLQEEPDDVPKQETEQPPEDQISIFSLKRALLNLKRKRATGDPNDPGSRLQTDHAQEEVLKIMTALVTYLQEAYNIKLQFSKAQNLMRNLGFGRVVLSIIEDPKNTAMVSICLRYLHYFCYMNSKNLATLVPHLAMLVDYSVHHPSAAKLISSLINSIDDKQAVETHLKNVFNRVVVLMSSEGVADYIHIGRETTDKLQKQSSSTTAKFKQLAIYLRILSDCTIDDQGKPQKDHQLILLSQLINIPEIARIYESQFFFSVRKLIQNKQSKPFSESDHQFVEFYLGSLSLIADLGRYHPESKEQARRIIEVHILQEYLVSKKQIFLLKKEILKLYHYVRGPYPDIPRERGYDRIEYSQAVAPRHRLSRFGQEQQVSLCADSPR
jgi:hypothetical protein